MKKILALTLWGLFIYCVFLLVSAYWGLGLPLTDAGTLGSHSVGGGSSWMGEEDGLSCSPPTAVGLSEFSARHPVFAPPAPTPDFVWAGGVSLLAIGMIVITILLAVATRNSSRG